MNLGVGLPFGLFDGPFEVAPGTAVGLIGSHQPAMALAPDRRPGKSVSAGCTLPFDESQTGDRRGRDAAHALQVHEQPGIFQHGGQLGTGRFEGGDVRRLEVIGLPVLHHQNADLDHPFLDRHRQERLVGQFIGFRKIAKVGIAAGAAFTHRLAGRHHGTHQPLAGAHTNPIHRLRIQPDGRL